MTTLRTVLATVSTFIATADLAGAQVDWRQPDETYNGNNYADFQLRRPFVIGDSEKEVVVECRAELSGGTTLNNKGDMVQSGVLVLNLRPTDEVTEFMSAEALEHHLDFYSMVAATAARFNAEYANNHIEHVVATKAELEAHANAEAQKESLGKVESFIRAHCKSMRVGTVKSASNIDGRPHGIVPGSYALTINGKDYVVTKADFVSDKEFNFQRVA